MSAPDSGLLVVSLKAYIRYQPRKGPFGFCPGDLLRSRQQPLPVDVLLAYKKPISDNSPTKGVLDPLKIETSFAVAHCKCRASNETVTNHSQTWLRRFADNSRSALRAVGLKSQDQDLRQKPDHKPSGQQLMMDHKRARCAERAIPPEITVRPSRS